MEEPPKHPAVAALFAELLAATSLNAAGLAKKLDITPQAISNYVVGRNEPGRKMMAAIIKAFPAINAVWLATGEGVPFPNGVHNEKVEQPYKEHLRKAAALSAEMTKSNEAATLPASEPATTGPSSNIETVATAENILLREQVAELKADKARLLQDNGVLRDENKLLLGKPFDSSDAADEFPTDEPTTPTAPAGHLPKPVLRVQVRGLRRYQE
jgi:plasmid maintenance system antidote protein VapI